MLHKKISTRMVSDIMLVYNQALGLQRIQIQSQI
jgi:hypothetical protein